MEWISVKDRLPTHGQAVIAVGTWFGEINGEGSDNCIAIGTYDSDLCISLDSDTYNTELVCITHWMPLPELPTK